MHRDKSCPFSGITRSGRVWRKVLESNTQSVGSTVSHSKRRSCVKVEVDVIGSPSLTVCMVSVDIKQCGMNEQESF